MNDIIYSRTVLSGAAIKAPKQSGMRISNSLYRDNTIMIEAINPRRNTVTTGLFMEIPKEDIDKVIDLLTKMK